MIRRKTIQSGNMYTTIEEEDPDQAVEQSLGLTLPNGPNQRVEARPTNEIDRVQGANSAERLAKSADFTLDAANADDYARAVKLSGGPDVQPGQTPYFIDPSERRRQIEALFDQEQDERKKKGWAI